MVRTAATVAVLAILAIASVAAYETYLANPGSPCKAIRGGGILRSQLSGTTFSGVIEYKLPGQNRWPNAVTTASDGSVWFAEQEVPGVAHFYPGNGTLVEYAWPGFGSPKPPDCVPNINVSGIAIWNGRVWAADEFDNRTFGLRPGDGSVVSVTSSASAPYPYWLAAGPDGNLWFTSSNMAGQPTRLGKILPDMTLNAVNLVGLGNDQPFQLDFVNSTFALLSTLNEAVNSTTHVCICTGHIYSFDPGSAGSTVTPARIGGGYRLTLPTGVTYSNGSVWVAQHGGSSVARYDLSKGTWTSYPTSVVPWTDVTLPLVVGASGSRVWFNEHYANRIALLNPISSTLTEFSESDPLPTSYQGIQNDLSIAPSQNGLWFTSLSGNYVGFVNANYQPGFSVQLRYPGCNTCLPTVYFQQQSQFGVQVTGTWSKPLSVSVSDSENYTSIPHLISLRPNATSIGPGSGPVTIFVNIHPVSRSGSSTLPPGHYTVALTVSDGLVSETVYLFINVL